METPEGVELGLRVAGPVVRAWAWFVDSLIRWFVQIAGMMALGVLGGAGMGLVLVWVFFVEWFYYVAFEVWSGGQTPGKRLFDLRVVHDDGTPVGWTAALMRNLLRFADLCPLLAPYGFGLLSMLTSRDFKRLGDRAAGTVVVHVDRRAPVPVIPTVPPVRPPVALDPEEQLALLDFARRVPTWTRARAIELGDHLEPMTGARGVEGVRRTLGIARWTAGER